MKKVFILVEGQTEENFINTILNKYFSPKNIFLIPIIISTKRVKSGGKFRGGVTSYQKVRNEILKLLSDTSVDLVTTMIDYYGLPTDFPSLNHSLTDTDPIIFYLEEAFENDIDSSKFKAFLVKHEFEGLLFSKPEEIAKKLIAKQKLKLLQKIRDDFASPEDINNDPNTAPSKRILKIIPEYDKVSDGSIIADRIGLTVIRKECKHFDNWIKYIIS